MIKTFSALCCALFFIAFCSCSKSEEEPLDLIFELQVIDSIQVGVMESISAIDYKENRGVIYSIQNHKISVFDSNGNIIKSKIYPEEGPGSVGMVTNLRILDNGDILLYPFMNNPVILNDDLEVKKHLKMAFPSGIMNVAYFQHMFDVYGEDAYLFYPGRDGGNPYQSDFFKDFKLLEKVNLQSGTAEAVYKLPNISKYQSDLTYEYPQLTLSAGNDKIYLALDTESLIHIYDPKSNSPEAMETLDFKPKKFVQMPGEKSESVSSHNRLVRGEVKNLYPVSNGLAVYYSEGIDEEKYQRESLHEKENWSKWINFNAFKLKVFMENKGWSNEIQVPSYITTISGLDNLDEFIGLRNDVYLGEEQDFLTFYKMRLVRK